jgi:hypothetical protein
MSYEQVLDSDSLMDSSTDEDNNFLVSEDNTDDLEPIGDINLEIVGLNSHSNGRFCCIHPVCGDFVKVGDLLRMVPTVVTILGLPEPAIKLVKMVDGQEGCTVAFVPKVQATLPIVLANLQKFCVVKVLYNISGDSYTRKRSYRNMGMAGVVVVGDHESFPSIAAEGDEEQQQQEEDCDTGATSNGIEY